MGRAGDVAHLVFSHFPHVEEQDVSRRDAGFGAALPISGTGYLAETKRSRSESVTAGFDGSGSDQEAATQALE